MGEMGGGGCAVASQVNPFAPPSLASYCSTRLVSSLFPWSRLFSDPPKIFSTTLCPLTIFPRTPTAQEEACLGLGFGRVGSIMVHVCLLVLNSTHIRCYKYIEVDIDKG